MSFSPSPSQLQKARRQIIRSTLIWLPIFVLFASIAVFFLVRALTEESGAWIGFAIVGLIALLTMPLLIAALQDLRAAPIETEGQLARKWRKSDFLIAKAHYVMVGKRVFRLDSHTWLQMPDVPARVHVLHYPHTNTLVDWRRSESDEEVGPAPAARPWRTVTAPLATAAPTTTDAAPAPPSAPAVQPPSFGAPLPPRRVEPSPRPGTRVDPPRCGAPPRDPDA
ncbi:MAG: hypothetical protein DK306_002156 [Chloroflexi bacterium]|nr:MAG: hypothetical protein DK306_002156 [Chloroflexota bacterium]